jgi:hypothetical protein
MRRRFLRNSCLFGLVAAGSIANAASRHVIDPRLLGVWRSNRELTMQNWRFEPGISPETKRLLSQTFGKVTWRFTNTQFFFQLDQSGFTQRYRVIAKDPISVVIAFGEEDVPSSTFQYIRFENDYLYILAAKYNLEFFSRVGA